jgi:hypothetical protein
MQLNDTFSQSAPQAVRAGGSGYRTIEAVLHDDSLDVQQKRAILSSWASDLFAVESCPWLRDVPGVAAPLRVGDIFAALRSLDDDPPPRGGACIRAFPAMRRTTDARMRLRPRFAELKLAR